MLAAMDCNSPFPELNVVEATVTDDLSLLLLLPVFRVLDVIIFPVELDMAPPTPGDSVNFFPTPSTNDPTTSLEVHLRRHDQIVISDFGIIKYLRIRRHNKIIIVI